MDARPELETYIEGLRRAGKSEATTQNNNGYCNSFLVFTAANGIGDLADISAETVRQFTAHLWRKSFTDATIRSIVGGVLQWCRWLENNGKIVASPSFKTLSASELLLELKRNSPLRRG